MRVHAAIREFGETVARASFEVWVIGEKDYILALEEKAIQTFRTRNHAFGYNMARNSPPLMTPETAAKISATLKGRKRLPEHAAKTAAGNRGKKKSPEARANMSAAWERNREANVARNKGRVVPDETRAKIREARKRQITSDETKAKMSVALRGRRSPMKGRRHSPEALARMSDAQKVRRKIERGEYSDLHNRP